MKNSERYHISVDESLCVGCGNCQKDCMKSAIKVIDKKAVVVSQGCNKCGHCVAVCPTGAVTISGFSNAPMERGGFDRLDPDELLAAISLRRSVRRFKPDAVPDDVLARVIEAGRMSPTSRNRQDVSYIVLQDGARAVEDMAVKIFTPILPVAKIFIKGWRTYHISSDYFFKKAPLVVIVCSGDRQNGHIAAANMELEAEACGLGVMYSGMFAVVAGVSKKIQTAIGLRKGEHIAAVLVMGCPDVKFYRAAPKADADVRYL